MRSWQQIGYVVAVLAALGTAPAPAQDAGGSEALVITAENLMAGDARHQELGRRGGDPNVVLPGDIVLYRLVFTNIADVPVRAVEFNDPLPAGLPYVGGSAAADRDDVVIAYSIDGGRTYTTRPMVEEIAEGEQVRRPAPPEMYTHIRWTVHGWVQPGGQVTAEFRAKLPEAAPVSAEPGELTHDPALFTAETVTKEWVR